jgi:hypothetical protein
MNLKRIVEILATYLPFTPGDSAALSKELEQLSGITKDMETAVGPGGQVIQLRAGNAVMGHNQPFRLYNPDNGHLTVEMKPSGDVLFGSQVTRPEGVSLAVFSRDQRYNGEQVGEGDQLLGDNSTGKANILWDRSEGILRFRGGVNDQAYIDTDGNISFGGGVGKLNADGIELITPTSATADINAYKFVDGAVKTGGLYAYKDANGHVILLQANSVTGKASGTVVLSTAPTTYPAQVTLRAISGAVSTELGIIVDSNASPTMYTYLYAGDFWIQAGDERVSGGLYVGSTIVDPDTDDIWCDGLISTDGGATKWELGGESTIPTPDVGVLVTIGGHIYKLAAEKMS